MKGGSAAISYCYWGPEFFFVSYGTRAGCSNCTWFAAMDEEKYEALLDKRVRTEAGVCVIDPPRKKVNNG